MAKITDKEKKFQKAVIDQVMKIEEGKLEQTPLMISDYFPDLYVISATSTGKTKLLQFLIQQDIEKRNDSGVIDPHGDLLEGTKGLLASP